MCFRFKRQYEEAINNLNLSLKIQKTKETILLLGNIYKESGNLKKPDTL